MKTIYCIKTKNEWYLSDTVKTSYGSHGLGNLYFNDEKPENTFDKSWVSVKSKPNKIHKLVSQPNINYRYELKSDLPISSEIIKSLKKVVKREDVSEYIDDEYTWALKDEDFKLISNFYELKVDKQDPKEELIEFQLEVLTEIEIFESIEYKEYRVLSDRNWTHKGTRVLKFENIIKNYLVDEMLVPSILLKDKPCQIDGNALYEIVRQHIKDNINPKVAEITTNYSFCFTVKKKINLSKPYTTQHEILTKAGKSYRSPKYRKKLHTSKEIEIFEMTPPREKYRKYTVLSGLRGDNHDDLQKNLDLYLEELISVINEPLQVCDCCNGTGVVLNN